MLIVNHSSVVGSTMWVIGTPQLKKQLQLSILSSQPFLNKSAMCHLLGKFWCNSVPILSVDIVFPNFFLRDNGCWRAYNFDFKLILTLAQKSRAFETPHHTCCPGNKFLNCLYCFLHYALCFGVSLLYLWERS